MSGKNVLKDKKRARRRRQAGFGGRSHSKANSKKDHAGKRAEAPAGKRKLCEKASSRGSG